MPIADRNLPNGTRLVARFKKQDYACTVKLLVEGQEPLKRVYVLDHDGSEHTSPSAAGSAVMNGTPCNGWRFWSLAGDEHLATPLKPARASKQPKARLGGKLIKRLTSQKEVEPGMLKYFCASCLDTFIAPAGEQPTSCPRGHAAIDEPAAAATTA